MRLKKLDAPFTSEEGGNISIEVASFYISYGKLDVSFNPLIADIKQTKAATTKSNKIIDLVESMGVDTGILTHQKLATIFLNQNGLTLHGTAANTFYEMMSEEELPQLGGLVMDIIEPFLIEG